MLLLVRRDRSPRRRRPLPRYCAAGVGSHHTVKVIPIAAVLTRASSLAGRPTHVFMAWRRAGPESRCSVTTWGRVWWRPSDRGDAESIASGELGRAVDLALACPRHSPAVAAVTVCSSTSHQ